MEENYKFTTKMNLRLSMEVDAEDMAEIVNNIDCTAPEKHGIENSERIIPHYYKYEEKTFSEIRDADYLNIIKDDIRNMRPLKPFQLEYLKNIDSIKKDEIINLFNECIKCVEDLISLE